jgi:uncharacterized membrane protein YfcA
MLALAAGFGGGAINAIAGGGTILSFPALLFLGVPAVQANATSAVALWPGRLGGTWGFRRELAQVEHWWYWLAVPSVAGGIIGAYLLVNLPPETFKSAAPFLVLGATALMAFEPWLEHGLQGHLGKRHSTKRRILAGVGEFCAAVYGGYFGAGIGILLLAVLGVFGVRDVHRANGLKNLYGLLLAGAAVAYFILTGAVVWGAAIPVAVGGIVGGYAGASLADRFSERTLRFVIVGIGIAMAVLTFLRMPK